MVEILLQVIDALLHLDKQLGAVIAQYGGLTYVILAAIIFCETGLVVTPFLPGDSLLFAAGAVAATTGALDPVVLFVLLAASAIIGDSCNYAIGQALGPRVFSKDGSRWLSRKHLERTHRFYERYGAETIIIARFVPIVRTFAPFVAGMGTMTYRRFLTYNVIGGIAWVGLFVFGGYFFGNLPLVKNNFTLVIGGIILISLLPAVVEFLRHRWRREPGTSGRRVPRRMPVGGEGED